MPRACIYCDCRDNRPCMIPVEQIDDATTMRELGVPMNRLATTLTDKGRFRPCWWISTRPLVCSNPACRKKHAEQAA